MDERGRRAARYDKMLMFDVHITEPGENYAESQTTEAGESLAVPSARTAVTGSAHWEILARARAVENLCYVAAAAQGGFHANGRETHGDSMIVDPWGLVLDRLPRGAGVVSADIEPARLRSIRRYLPAIRHQRLQCRLPEGN